MVCVVKHKGQDYTFEEFKEYLKKGGADDLITSNHKFFNDYAKAISGNKKELSGSGEISSGSKEISGDDVQSSAIETPINGETSEPPREEGIRTMVDMGDLPFRAEEGDITRLAHKDTESLYEELNTSGRVPREAKTDEKLEKESNDLISKGYDFEAKAKRVLDSNEGFTDAEQVAFAKIVGALKIKQRQFDVLSPEFDKLQDKIELLSRASDKVGSEEGAAFRARRLFVLNDQTLSDYIQRDKESLGVDELTESQKTKNKEEFENIQQKQSDYDQKIKDLEEENTKLKAEAEVKKTKSGSKKGVKKSHEDFVSERKDILSKMRDDLLKAAKGGGGLTASVPGAAQLAAIAPHVAKLVKSLVEEGVDKLEDVVKNIHSELKDIVDGISEKDVHDLIAGKYNEKKSTKSELSTKLRDLKDEAKLINELESLQNGEVPKTEKQKIERNKRITELKQQIKELKGDVSKLSAIKSRNESELKKVNEQLASGDFGPEEKSTSPLENEELKYKFPEEFEAAMKSRDALRAAKNEREVRILKQQYANRSKFKKGLDVIAEIGNTPRALMSSLDFSAPLRQGLWGVTKQLFSRPGDLKNQFALMFKVAASQKTFDRWFADLQEAPDYPIMEKVGLPLSNPLDPRLTVKEEQFMSHLAEKIPVVGKLVKASERAYVGFLNKMRVDLFRRAADTFASEGKTYENSPELYEAMSNYIGAATGRGKMPEILEKSAPILNAAFFSPRLIASRLNLLTNWANPGFYAKIPKEVRVQYFKDLGKFIGLGLTVLALAKAGGAEVEDDPRSSDFGKIKSGDTRWDIWGGFQQYIRLAAQLYTGQKKSSTSGTIKDLDGKGQFGETRADVLFRFARGKLAPVPSIAVDFLSGRDVTGKEATIESEASKTLPLVTQDIFTAAKDKGVADALLIGIPAMFGVGVQSYGGGSPGGSGGGSGAGSQYKIKEWR